MEKSKETKEEQVEKTIQEFQEQTRTAEKENNKLSKKTDSFIQDESLKDHLNIVFIGHVDAGKSTIAGQILLSCGIVDQRTIEKYEKEAKENNRASWFLAYVMDTNEEERAKGKTVEVGRDYFETKYKRYTILDAPGHKNYVPNMIGGASQADIAILVISAKKGEFESGFHKNGQTREHSILAKTLGIKHLIVAINKMDDDTVNWDKVRYDDIVIQLSQFLKLQGFNIKNDVTFIPVSGLKGYNIVDCVSKKICLWFDGMSMLQILDNFKPIERLSDLPLRFTVDSRSKEEVFGKIESGRMNKGEKVLVMPNKLVVEIIEIFIDSNRSVGSAGSGEIIRIILKGIEEDQINKGFVLCSPISPVHCQTRFEAIINVLQLNNIMSAGYPCNIHIHNATEECSVLALLELIDKKTGDCIKKKPTFVTSGSLVKVIIETTRAICIENYSNFPQLGRFTLRDKTVTIAVGKVTAVESKKKINKNEN